MLLEELKKVTEEIKLRLSNIDTWFHCKFVLLGGVFLVSTGRLGRVIDLAYPWRPQTQAPVIRRKQKRKQLSEEDELQGFLNSKAAHCVLGQGCVIALTVDMHIRHELDAIISLGNWVAHYAEPALSGIEFQERNQGQFLLWGNFLRAEDESGKTVLGTALHNMPHLYVLTLLVYVLYIWTFQNIICAQAMGQAKTAVMGTFWIVNGTLVAFGISASNITKVPWTLYPWPLLRPIMPFLLALALVVVNFVCWKLLQKKICTARNPVHPSDSAPNSRGQTMDENAGSTPAATSAARS